MISKSIEDFLSFLREMKSTNQYAIDSEREADNLTQDLLHTLELDKHNAVEYTQIAIKLRGVRRQRRAAKDLIATTTPIVRWMEDNDRAIHSIERLLGDVRKEEKAQQNRIYIPRAKENQGR